MLFKSPGQDKGKNMLVAKKDYYLDADGKLTADVQKSATLLIRRGQEIGPELKEKLGDKFEELEGVEADQLPAETDPDAEGEDEDEAEHKQGEAPAQNKAGRPKK